MIKLLKTNEWMNKIFNGSVAFVETYFNVS